jgi:CubicO group peptidase (beta-lactamase class C family)
MRQLFFRHILGFTVFFLVGAATLEAQTFDSLTTAIEAGSFGNLDAVVIARNGDIIYEEYFRGTGADDLHQVQSITKSIGSALIGIAHRQGKIQLDQDLDHFFGGIYPMSSAPFQDKSGITVEQVLQQRHGIEWDEGSTDYRHMQNPVNRMVMSDDWYRFVLGQPLAAAPGQTFNYSSGASTLMSRMIRVATGMGPDEFAMQELFAPLGIDQVHWEMYSEDGMGHGRTDWPPPDQDVSLGFGLWLRARDLVTIGELYRNGGIHEEHRLLDQSWIDASWTRYSHSGNSDFFTEPGWGHGYQWWIARVTDSRDRDWDVYFASGWGSQVIFIIPGLDLVLVTVGSNQDYNGPDVDALLVSLLPELNPVLDERFNAAWYNPLNDGQGLTLEIQPDGITVVSFWYTYRYDGTQRWFLLQGEIVDGVAEVTIYETSGGVFLQDNPYLLEEWGTGRFRTIDCNHMSFEFESDEISTTIPLTRLTGACDDTLE